MLLRNLEQIRDRIHEPLPPGLWHPSQEIKRKSNYASSFSFVINSLVISLVPCVGHFCTEWKKSIKNGVSCGREMRHHGVCCYWEPGERGQPGRAGAVTACAWLFTRAELGGQPCLDCPAQAGQSCLEFRRGERGGDYSDRLHPAWSLDTRRHHGRK